MYNQVLHDCTTYLKIRCTYWRLEFLATGRWYMGLRVNNLTCVCRFLQLKLPGVYPEYSERGYVMGEEGIWGRQRPGGPVVCNIMPLKTGFYLSHSYSI